MSELTRLILQPGHVLDVDDIVTINRYIEDSVSSVARSLGMCGVAAGLDVRASDDRTHVRVAAGTAFDKHQTLLRLDATASFDVRSMGDGEHLVLLQGAWSPVQASRRATGPDPAVSPPAPTREHFVVQAVLRSPHSAPAGVVLARVTVEGGLARTITFQDVPYASAARAPHVASLRRELRTFTKTLLATLERLGSLGDTVYPHVLIAALVQLEVMIGDPDTPYTALIAALRLVFHTLHNVFRVRNIGSHALREHLRRHGDQLQLAASPFEATRLALDACDETVQILTQLRIGPAHGRGAHADR